MQHLPKFERRFPPVSEAQYYAIKESCIGKKGITDAAAIGTLLRDAKKLATAEGLDDGITRASIDFRSDDRLHGLRVLIAKALDTSFAFAEEREFDAIGRIFVAEVCAFEPCGDDVYCFVVSHLAMRDSIRCE